MTGNKKNVLLVCDMPGYGKVATAVMIPILSYMGHPTYNIPTMLIPIRSSMVVLSSWRPPTTSLAP